MKLSRACHQFKFGSELIRQICWTIPHDIQPTASRWSFERERRHDHMPVASHRTAHGLHISKSLVRLREKMKYGAVMPDVIPVRRKLDRGDISLDPFHRSSTSAKSLPGKLKCRSSQIKDRDVLVARREQFIHERGSPPSHINDLRRLGGPCALNQL